MKDVFEFIIGLVVEFIKMLVTAIILQIILFNLGRFFLLAATLGKFPRGRQTEDHGAWIVLTGFLLIFIAWSSLAIYNNFFLVETVN